MNDNPYQAPKATRDRSRSDTPSSTWWEGRRLHYNIGLFLAGILAFVCYVVVCFTLLPRVLDASEIEFSGFTALFQGVCYLLLMGLANVCYFLGPLSEWIFRPRDVQRYRRLRYRIGFWFSVLLPFAIPTLLTIQVLFFPGYWQH